MNTKPFAFALAFAWCSLSPAFSAAPSVIDRPVPTSPDSMNHLESHPGIGIDILLGDSFYRTTTFLPVRFEDADAVSGQDIPEEVRRKIRHEFGFTFLVFRDKVQEELNLTSDQKDALDKYLHQIAPANVEFFQSIEAKKPEERQSQFEAHRSKALEDLDSQLKKTLSSPQQKRLAELVRQREGLFGGPSLWGSLDITEGQKQQFMGVIEPMHKKMEAAVAQSQQGGNPHDVERQVLALRADLELQMEAILTDSQRKLWKDMVGKPVSTTILFDMASG